MCCHATCLLLFPPNTAEAEYNIHKYDAAHGRTVQNMQIDPPHHEHPASCGGQGLGRRAEHLAQHGGARAKRMAHNIGNKHKREETRPKREAKARRLHAQAS